MGIVLQDISFNIGGSEWVVIILLAAFLLFGNNKLPQLGRTLGKWIGEYEKAKRTIQDEITKSSKDVKSSLKFDSKSITSKLDRTTSMTTNVDENTTLRPMGPVATEREKLEVIARTLEIEPRGKSTDELKQLISSKMNQ